MFCVRLANLGSTASFDVVPDFGMEESGVELDRLSIRDGSVKQMFVRIEFHYFFFRGRRSFTSDLTSEQHHKVLG